MSTFWRFADRVDDARSHRLQEYADFATVQALVLEYSVSVAWWEPATSVLLRGAHRASFAIRVSPDAYDAFFNSPLGYRAQYARSITEGEKANRQLLSALEPGLVDAAARLKVATHSSVLASLRASRAKLWILESEVEQQLSDAPSIIFPAWEFESLAGQGLRAPVGTLLEVKGAWMDPLGKEVLDPTKAHRSEQVHKTGFS